MRREGRREAMRREARVGGLEREGEGEGGRGRGRESEGGMKGGRNERWVGKEAEGE